MIQEVAHNIFRILVPSPVSVLKPPVNLYYFGGKDGLLWDAGYGTRSDVGYVIRDLENIFKLMRKRGEKGGLENILISHAHTDHFAGMAPLRQHTGANILLTPAMAARTGSERAYRKAWQENPGLLRPHAPTLTRVVLPFLEWMQDRLCGVHWIPDPDIIIPPAHTLKAGNRILTTLPVPGHADDHIALYCPAEGLIFSGDLVLRTMTPWLGPPRSNINDYEDSLARLSSLPLNRIFPAHGSPIEAPAVHLAKALAHSKKRTARVLHHVLRASKEGIAFHSLIKQLYPRSSAVMRLSAEGWVLLTLRMLIEEKKIRARKKGVQWCFAVL
ncbi:MBL fold metallo-hydrolase [Desulfobotulus sp. H1]|uniref:MBL fold metallo-hydrolase n=1 Tax=Desulfobotulus pelophilus TaxID=2823377 RepID=A0ABT3NAF2_9BACT|nr:MBL fold metallo-hydrolase [Desulfobotulus pelophilus]MCW7754445.1 MBL fold metallo-hydrolase [Desulfobotulus pelophilus]